VPYGITSPAHVSNMEETRSQTLVIVTRRGALNAP